MNNSLFGTLATMVAFHLLPALPAQIFVSAGNPNCPGTGTRNDPFCTIQDGINAAGVGDVVLVEDGVYTGPGNTNLFFPAGPQTSLTLASVNGPRSCFIDMQGSGSAFFFVANEPSTLIIVGFTVRNGVSSTGGAVFLHHDASPTFVNCRFVGNTASAGGAVFSDATDGTPRFLNCSFLGNSAGSGGAVHLTSDDGVTTFVNCVMAFNSASLDGGAVQVANFSEAELVNCTLADNTAARSGGGLFSNSIARTTVINSIVWGNNGGQIAGPATVTFSNVQGGHAGAGNIALNPEFADAARADYHLLATSPCIDAGTPAGAVLVTDFEGDPRPAFGQVDMGADEFFWHLYHLGNATPGATVEVKLIGRPGEPSFWLLAARLAPAAIVIPGISGALLLDPQSLVAVGLGAMPAQGLIARGVTIPAGAPMTTVPTQALIGLQLTNLDPLVIR